MKKWICLAGLTTACAGAAAQSSITLGGTFAAPHARVDALTSEADISSLSAKPHVEVFNSARAREPNGPMLTSIRRGAHPRMVDLINKWLMELGITTV